MLRIAERIGETVVEYCLRRRIRCRISVAIDESEEMRIHRHISGIDLAAYGQPPHAGSKNIARPPGVPIGVVIGKNGAWKESWSTEPTSSRT